MTSIAELLVRSAEELRRFQETHRAMDTDATWLNRLANRLTAASTLAPHEIELEVQAIARALIDSGPTDERAIPSFWAVVDVLQRR